MIQVCIKLKPTPRQARQLDHWLRHLTSVWNWAIKKIEHDAADKIYHRLFDLKAILNGHGAKVGVSQDTIEGILTTAHTSWRRCFTRIARKPRLKGRRNRLNSIPFAHGTRITEGRLHVRAFGRIRFHKQTIPESRITQFRLIKRPSGWYAYLTMHDEPRAILATGNCSVGIDPGFSNLLTLSNGEKIEHPREFQASALRLAQAERGANQKLTSRIQERVRNQRRNRNHKLSRRLVSENQLIAFSADRHHLIAKKFGKSVGDSAHYQLRQILAYKCRAGGRRYVEVPSRNSTRTCSTCGALSGPHGWAGLKVRQWTCAQCGTEHDRDVNAAINTLIAGAGLAHEMPARAAWNL